MKHLIAAFAILTCSVACGGGSGNSQLKRRVTYEHLAPLPAEQRGHELEVYKDVFMASWQLEYTKGLIAGAELEIKIAKNDLASAKISAKSAGIEMKAADESGELNRTSEATRGEQVARLEIDMNKVKLDRAKTNLTYLKKRLSYEERMHRSREAELESVKADSLKGAGIKPPGFEASKYKAQFKDRQSQAKASEAEVNDLQKQVAALDAKLAAAKQAVELTKAGGKAQPEEAVTPTEPIEPLEPIEPVVPDESAQPENPEAATPDASSSPATAPASKPAPAPTAGSAPTPLTPAPKGN